MGVWVGVYVGGWVGGCVGGCVGGWVRGWVGAWVGGWVRFNPYVFVCIRSSLHSVHFGPLLRCAHKCIVYIMKVYIEGNSIQTSGIYTIPYNSDFIAVGNFEVGIYFRDRCAHCYPRRVATILFRGRRTFRRMTTSVHAISGHI